MYARYIGFEDEDNEDAEEMKEEEDMTIGKKYTVVAHPTFPREYKLLDDVGDERRISKDNFEIIKAKNYPKEVL